MTLQPYNRSYPMVLPGVVEIPPISQHDYELLRDSMTTMRDLLVCKCLRGTGLRINELLRVMVSHVQENGPDTSLWIAREKKRSPKPVYGLVPIQQSLGIELRSYIKGSVRPPADQRVFRVTDRQVRRVFAVAGLKAIGRSVHPHELRGLYIKTLVDGGVPIEAAAKMVGHADPKTTLKYYYDLTAEQRYEIQRRIPV